MAWPAVGNAALRNCSVSAVYVVTGKLLVKALVDGVPLSLPLAPSLYKHLLGLPPTMQVRI